MSCTMSTNYSHHHTLNCETLPAEEAEILLDHVRLETDAGEVEPQSALVALQPVHLRNTTGAKIDIEPDNLGIDSFALWRKELKCTNVYKLFCQRAHSGCIIIM